ncbi:sarcosine oxidase [Pseudomonas sp. DC3000-4b1]|uniref:sarcosine oxidase n=1 Tax=unclassified Pseudomonas TaxID=196821 RepID=UPI003CF5F37A
MSSASAEARVQPLIDTTLSLADCTDVSRVGFRGAQAASWLEGLGLTLPQRPNKAVKQQDGSLVARLSQTEYLWLGAIADQGARVGREEARWEQNQTANYLLPRQDSHAWLQLSGDRISEVMAKLCGVNLHPSAFCEGDVAQTSVARLSCIVINATRGKAPCFYLLFDRPSLAYLKEVLVDAMDEFQRYRGQAKADR